MRTLRLISLLTFVSGASLAQAQQAPATPPAPTAQTAPSAQPAPVQYAQPGPVQYAQPYAQPAPVQYAQPYAPPPPPGYAYPRPQDPAQRAATITELTSVDAQMATVQRERSNHRIGGPIAMMGIGYGLGALFGTIGLIQWSIADDIDHGDFDYYNRNDSSYYYDSDSNLDLNNDGVINGKDEHRARRTARIMGGLSLVSTGVGIAGTILLVRKLAKRRESAPELERLRTRKLELLRNLQYGGGLSQNGLQLTLGGTF
jgi:hypothetical protein